MLSHAVSDPWQELAESLFSTKGWLNDFVLAAIKQDKELDETQHPAQTYNYHFYQAIILSLPTVVAACENEAALDEKLTRMLDVSGKEALFDTWNAKFDKESARKYIKTETLNVYLRLYFRLEKLSRLVAKLKKYIVSSKEYDLSPAGFHDMVVVLIRQCKELLAHVQINAFEMQRQEHVIPVIEFIHYLIALFAEKQLCKIALNESTVTMPQQMVLEKNSLVTKYQAQFVFTPVNELREMAAQMKNQPLVESEKWVEAKAQYAAMVDLLTTEIRDKVLVNSEQSAEAFLLILEALKKQKIICTNTAALDEFRALYLQFQQLTNPVELSSLIAELTHSVKPQPVVTERKASMTEKVGAMFGRSPIKPTPLPVKPVTTDNDFMSRLGRDIDKLSQQYETALENDDIFCRLRQSSDSLDNAYHIAQQWQLANAQLRLIVESALHAFNEMRQLLEGVEKKDPEQVKSFFSRRLPEMSISFGASNATGGAVLLVLNFAAGVAVPMFSIPLIVLVSCLVGLGVGVGRDAAQQLAADREAAAAGNINHDNVQTGTISTLLSSFFRRGTNNNSEVGIVLQEQPRPGK